MSLRDPLAEKYYSNDNEEQKAARIGANARCDKTRFVPLGGEVVTLPHSHFVEALALPDYSEIRFVYSTRVVVVTGERLEPLLTRFEANQLRMIEQVQDVRDQQERLVLPDGKFAVLGIRYEEPVE